MSLSVSNAWDETVALVRRAGWRLFAVAFLLLALPGAVLRLFAPITAAGDPPRIGLWLGLAPVVLVAALIGALAISRLALDPEEGLGASFSAGFRRLLPLLGAAILACLAGTLLLVAAAFAATAIEPPVLAMLPVVGGLVLIAFLWVRLLFITPIAAAEPIGTLALLARSWTLTSGHVLRLFGSLVVVGLVSLVALIAAGSAGGVVVRLTAGQPQPGTLAMVLVLLISAVLQAAISGLFAAFVARLYAQRADALAG